MCQRVLAILQHVIIVPNVWFLECWCVTCLTQIAYSSYLSWRAILNHLPSAIIFLVNDLYGTSVTTILSVVIDLHYEPYEFIWPNGCISEKQILNKLYGLTIWLLLWDAPPYGCNFLSSKISSWVCNALIFLVNSGTKTVISAIDRRLGFSQIQDSDECESALEALGQIGSCMYVTAIFQIENLKLLILRTCNLLLHCSLFSR